jgi:hypothetical protein
MKANNTASPLGLADWHQQLADVARRAGELPTNASLDDRASLAQDAFQLLWLAWSPALIAQSCRLSARLNEPLMADPGPLDEQLLSVHDVRSQCLRSVDQLAIKKLLPLPKRFSIQGRPHQTKAAAAEVVEEVAAEVPARPVEARIAEARAAAVRVKPPLRPIAERLAARTPAPAPEPEPELRLRMPLAEVPSTREGHPCPGSRNLGHGGPTPA